MDEKKEMRTAVKVVIGIAAAVFTAFAAVTATMFAILRRNMKKAGNPQDKNNLFASFGLGRSKRLIDGDMDSAFLACIAGTLNVSWADIPTKDQNIDLTVIGGKVTIIVPDTMRVSIETDADVNENIEEFELPEDAPLLTITGKSILGKVTVLR